MGKERDNMIKVKGKKVIAMLLLILTLCSTFSGFSFATEISEANLQNKGDCGYHLQYWNAENALPISDDGWPALRKLLLLPDAPCGSSSLPCQAGIRHAADHA